MRSSLGFRLSEDFSFDMQSGRNRLYLIEGFRLLFLVAVFVIFLAFQIRESYFISLDLVIPIYGFLFFAFLLNAGYLLSFDRWPKALPLFTAFLFAFDNVFITALVYTTGSSESIFLFLYLVNILLSGLVFKRRGSLTIALFSSITFSLLMILNPSVDGTRLYFTMGVNNLAFFAVALLSGYLSEQMGFMGERIQAQEKDIKVLQDLNKLIVDSMPSGLLTFDRSGIIIHCNIAAQKILSDEAKGKSVDVFFAGTTSLILTDSYNRVGRHRGDVVYIDKDERRMTLGMTVSPLMTDDGKSFGHILLFQDLTQIKMLEEMANRNEKMAAIGQLAAGIAHEIRNPLASISGSIQLLKADDSTPENEKLFSIVLKEIDRLNLLITEFLDFARPEGTPNDPVDVNQVISEVMDMVKLNDKLPKGVQQVRILNSKSKILAQPDKLKQVFLNLVINAYQAMEKKPDGKITIKTYEREGHLFAEVEDTGDGMKPELANRIFEPFLTTKPKGTGLGLATVHKILDNHGARIGLSTQLGVGTKFTIEFSRIHQPNPDQENANVIDLQRRRSQG